MASPASTNYTLTPSKPHSAPHNSICRRPQLHPSTMHTPSPRIAAPSCPAAQGTAAAAILSAASLSTFRPPYHGSGIYLPTDHRPGRQNAARCGFFPPPVRPSLGPDFRRARTTRVVSKRNLTTSSRSSGAPPSSSAASRCINEVMSSQQEVSSVLAGYQGCLVAPEDYIFMLNEFGDRGGRNGAARLVKLFDTALPLVVKAKEKGRLLTAAIGALGKMGHPELAMQVFDDGVANAYGNTVYAYSSLISAYARNGLAKEAIGVLSVMKSAALQPTAVTYNAVIDACGKGGGGFTSALTYFREMLSDGLCPDRKTFNSLLAACSRAGHLEEAHSVFESMISLGVGHDIYTYNTFVDTICKCGSMELAAKVVTEMEENGVKPNVVTYSTLIDGYSKLERYGDALNLYGKMKSLGLQLDRVCYNTLLSIYVKTGKYEEISLACEEMELLGIEKDTVTYNSLITGYGKQGRFDVVAYLVQDMKARGVASSVLTYSTLIDIYSKAGMYGDAARAFLEFKDSGLKADVVLYSSFIDTLSKNGLIECAMWLLDEMTQMGIEPNVVTYNSIIDAFGKSRALAEEDDRAELNGIIQVNSSQLVRASGQSTRGFGLPHQEVARQELFFILELFRKMVRQGVRPNVVTFSAILNACSRCDSFEDASLLLDQLRIFDNFVYGVAHGLLMGIQEVWVQAHALLDELSCMDLSTSSAFYNALTDMLWHFGQHQGAQRVVLEGANRRVWENTWSEFTLDLHLMSCGAAQAMVHAWLLNVRSIVFEGRTLPEFLSILTGWGKHSKIVGASTLRCVVEALLKSMGAPFQAERFNIGRFVSPGSMVAAWLQMPSTAGILLLHDVRVQVPTQANLVPRLQALHL